MMKAKLPDEVLGALAEAGRGPGWNNRNADVRRFEIGMYGLQCTLYVVPFRRWAYRRRELQTADYQRKRSQSAGSLP